MSALKIYTSSWRAQLPDSIQKVGISRGTPRGYPAGYRMLSAFKPGPWFKSVPPTEYVIRYYEEILQRADIKMVLDRLHEMQGDKEGVALLCFETPPFRLTPDRNGKRNWCHRRIAASWIEQQTGEEVPEYAGPDLIVGDSVPTGADMSAWIDLTRRSGSL
jgi:hypothetical protein